MQKSSRLKFGENRTKKSLIAVAIVLLVAGLFTKGISHFASAACTPLASDLGLVTGSFSNSTDGTYRVWSRIRTADATKNSFALQIDQTLCNVTVGGASIPANAWTWVDYQAGTTSSKIEVDLTAGTHTINMAGISQGLEVDRVILTRDTTCVPTGDGENCANPPDTTAPTVSLTAPASGATITGSYTMTATASDASGIKRVDFYIDSTLVSSDTSSPYSYNFNSTSLTNGTHNFRAVAVDNSPAANTASSATVTATVSNTVIAPEDINQDGAVNLLDFSILSANYGKSGAAITNSRADIDGNGTVNLLDFSRLSARYGK